MPFSCSTDSVCYRLRISKQTLVTARGRLAKQKLTSYTNGILLIANTNLTLKEIESKYGLRTYDRLRANIRIVIICSKSLRGRFVKQF